MYKWVYICIAWICFGNGSANALTVSVRDTLAAQGSAGVWVVIEVNDAGGIAGGELTLTYDATALQAKKIVNGELLTAAGILSVVNVETMGVVKISMAGGAGITSQSGVLLSVVFDVPFGAVPQKYPLTLSEVVLRNEQGQLLSTSGTIAGEIEITSAEVMPVLEGTGVSVALSDLSATPGDSAHVMDVTLDHLTGIAGGEVILKYNPFVLSNVKIQSMAGLDELGIVLLANLEKAGEIAVSFAGAKGLQDDVGGILFQIVFDVSASALNGIFPVQVEKVILLNELAQHFDVVGITSGTVRIGEVGPVVDIGNRRLTVGDVESKVGDTGQVVEIMVDDATDIAGGEITVQYDASVLEVAEVKGSSLIENAGMTLIPNVQESGVVKIVFASANGISGGKGALIQIIFDVKTDVPGQYNLLVTQATLQNENGHSFTLGQVAPGIVTVAVGDVMPPIGGEFDGSLPSGSRGPFVLDLDATLNDQSLVQSETPQVGDRIVVDMVITQDGEGLNGFNVVLTFDPKQFAYESFEVKDVFARAVVIENKDNLSEGRIGLNAAYLGTSVTSKAQGTVGQAVFEVIDGFTGLAQIAIASAQLAQDGVPTAVDIGSGGAFVVIGGGEPTSPTDPVARSDFSGDGKIGFEDFITFASAFGKMSSDAGFDARIDLNDNGAVDFSDFILFAGLFGKSVGDG